MSFVNDENRVDSNQNIQNILSLVQESSQVGNSCLKEMKRQNYILQKTNDELYEIHDELKSAERSLDNIESFWKRFVNWFSPQPDSTFRPPISAQKPIVFQSSHLKEGEDLEAILDGIQLLKTTVLLLVEGVDKSNDIIEELHDNTHLAQHRTATVVKRAQNIG